MKLELIDAPGIARLAGSPNKGFALLKRVRDPSFPKPVAGAGTPRNRYVWDRAEVVAWLKSHPQRTHNADPVQRLDNAMAQLIIRLGWKRGGRAIARLAGGGS